MMFMAYLTSARRRPYLIAVFATLLLIGVAMLLAASA